MNRRFCPGISNNQTPNGSGQWLMVDTSLAETKMRDQNRNLHMDSSTGTYHVEDDEAESAGEKLEIKAVSSNPFRQLSCNQNFKKLEDGTPRPWTVKAFCGNRGILARQDLSLEYWKIGSLQQPENTRPIARMLVHSERHGGRGLLSSGTGLRSKRERNQWEKGW